MQNGFMSTNDPYEGFADRYDLFPRDPADREFFRRLFVGNRVTRLLDCACGTGRDLLTFQSLGCEVVGSDLSPSMLSVARKTLEAAGIDAPLHRLDFRDLPAHFDRPFDAVVCLSGSLLEVADETEILRALSSMHAVLRPGGLLVLTQGMTDKLWRERPRFLLEINTAEFSRVFVIDYFERGARFNILDIHHTPEDAGLQVWTMEHPHVPLGADYERLLRGLGFADVRLFGGYDSEPYDLETSNRLIVVAGK